MAKLKAQHRKFADEYLIDLNATAAYGRAGYKAKGNSAEAAAARLLRSVKVQEYIQQRMKDREKRTEITQDRVLQELARIGFADIKSYLSFRTALTVIDRDDEGRPITDYAHVIELKDSDEVDGAAISEVGLKDGTLKFKLHDKVAALDKLGRHLGMFTDNVNVKGGLNNTTTDLTQLAPEERRARIDELVGRRGT